MKAGYVVAILCGLILAVAWRPLNLGAGDGFDDPANVIMIKWLGWASSMLIIGWLVWWLAVGRER